MFSKETYPFRLPELPYAYHALEPFIDQRTMYFHHDKHLKTYIDNLNKALEAYPEYQTWTLEELLTRLPELPEELRTPVRNNGGGVYNHEMYFHLMAPAGQPFSTEVAALGQFGSGFAWLVLDTTGALKIIALPNQDNPLTIGLQPILPLDVWEHAYYLKHQNLRSDYIDDWFHVINWNAVEQRLKDNL